MSTIKVNKIEKRTGSTLTLGGPGTAVTLACGATQTGFGRTGTVDWCTTAKTSPFTSESGKGYFVNTTSGAVTVTLPASPSAGDIVSIKDYANTFDTNNVTVGRNSSKIGGLCFDATLSTEGDSITLVYVDGTQGWLNIQTDDTIKGSAYVTATGGTITTCGDFKIHTFTSSDNFVVTNGGHPSGSNTVEYLVVAGGGASGADNAPSGATGGGGAGGFRFASPSIAPLTYPAKPLAGPAGLPVSAQTYPVTVGSGGSATALSSATSTQKGNNSVFSTITSTGGGGGGQYYTCGTPSDYFGGGPGGSGGGATGEPGPAAPGGSGNSPPVTPAQGTNGGLGADGSPSTEKGGGAGGGAIAAGGNASLGSTSGVGGDGAGLPTAFGSNGESCGSYRYYAGGGGGGIASAMPTGGAGGKGGGGNAGQPGANPAHPGQAGTANTGGGGGGNKVCASGNGQNGGSGIVVIRYKFQN